MNLQFYHGTKAKVSAQEYTVVVDVPNKEELRMNVWKVLGESVKTIPLLVGVTKVNPKDQYCRKTGRVESTKNLKLIDFELDAMSMGCYSMDPSSKSYMLYLTAPGVQVVLDIKPGRERVHLIDATI